MSYDSIIEVLALALLEQANEVGCLEVLDGFSQRPDTEIEVSAPISEEMLILPLDKQEWPEECAPILKESGATTLGELVEYLNHCAASGKKPNVSEDAAAAMFPALIAFCYNNADTDGKRFFWEYMGTPILTVIFPFAVNTTVVVPTRTPPPTAEITSSRKSAPLSATMSTRSLWRSLSPMTAKR